MGTEFRVWQIDNEKDEKRVCFLCLPFTRNHIHHDWIDKAPYEAVWHGTTRRPVSLDHIYGHFNKPENLQPGMRSLSVSDVVEIIQSDNLEPGFYFCDSIGWPKVEFREEEESGEERESSSF